MNIYEVLRMLLRDRRGIAAVEYAVLIGVVGAALFGAFNVFDMDKTMTDLFKAGTDAIKDAGG
jgi:Flp pilus assembly pilin Flp